MTRDQAEKVLSRIHYKTGYSLYFGGTGDGHLFMRWVFVRPDSRTGAIEEGEGGEVIFDPSRETEESIVRRAFGLVLAVEEHECREFFRYGLQRPFDPHRVLVEPIIEAGWTSTE